MTTSCKGHFSTSVSAVYVMLENETNVNYEILVCIHLFLLVV